MKNGYFLLARLLVRVQVRAQVNGLKLRITGR
jgi:hypothetical protein